MDIKLLEDFVCLATLENFTAASRERRITQSALSRRIKALEEWLGTEPPPEPKLSPIEQTKKDIASLQQRLKLLEYQETVSTGVEKAYRDFYGHYPIINMSTNDYDCATWIAFKEGYKAGQKND